MGIFVSVVILILVVLIPMLLQLTPGTFSIFYHYALGKNSTKKADDLSLGFILGTEIFTTITWITIYTLIFTSFCTDTNFCPNIVFWIMSGTILAESIIILLFYYRKGKSTSLFISRHTANALSTRARQVKTRSDAIMLGFFAGLPELIFTLPLYIISSIILLETAALPRAILVILYIAAFTLPLFIIRITYHTGRNLADITRFRLRIKPMVRTILFLLYFVLSFAVLNLGIINHG